MNENKVNPVIDLFKQFPYNAAKVGLSPPEGKEMTKKKPSIDEKKKIVADITKRHFEDGVPISALATEYKIREFDYYNWKKRVEQLAARKEKVKIIRHAAPVIIRRAPVKQSVEEAGTGTSPTPEPAPQPSPQKYFVIVGETPEGVILKELAV